VFLVCFSVVNPTSFRNVRRKWVPELRKHWPEAPMVLVGTQGDRKGDVRLINQLAGKFFKTLNYVFPLGFTIKLGQLWFKWMGTMVGLLYDLLNLI